MQSRDIISIVAILISPVTAVLVSMWIQNRREKRQERKHIFSSLMATRHQSVSDEIVRNLNMIDVAFYNKKKVRKLWLEYFGMLNNAGLNNPVGWKQWDLKRLELIQEMAKTVGYGKEITHIDAERIYMPTGLGEDIKKTRELGDQLLRVLKESQGFKLVQKEQLEKKES